ncbi:MAG: hypothetical protein DSM107014_11400 [Gomphosphaeria aponina SAG 52.96 = DSM 107014]|uniref:Uncharacterized protein n=1 Tax=Gomphosphaeria aponina SAG 52.96 = DSM 107014 TaxID=1521640 RepID=A0A941GS56_9CHRO|nr:hypothetical protein [Gomphosphaeria aponina SAG 52.96 = DSM 107014]
MSALANNQRPAGINTLERHLAYDVLLLARLNPSLRIVEQAGSTTRAVEVVLSPADDGSIRLIARLSLPVDPNYANDTSQPLYMWAQELSNVAIPANWKQA